MSKSIFDRWKVLARTAAGHTVLLAADLSEEQARELYGNCCEALMHIADPTLNHDNGAHVLEGDLGTVRLDRVEGVQLGYDRSVIRYE